MYHIFMSQEQTEHKRPDAKPRLAHEIRLAVHRRGGGDHRAQDGCLFPDGIRSGLLSDAIESLVNLAGALMALTMLIIAARPAEQDHVDGHSKAEYFASVTRASSSSGRRSASSSPQFKG